MSASVYEGHCLFFHCLWPHFLLFYFLPFLLCSISHHEQHVQLPRLVSGKHRWELYKQEQEHLLQKVTCSSPPLLGRRGCVFLMEAGTNLPPVPAWAAKEMKQWFGTERNSTFFSQLPSEGSILPGLFGTGSVMVVAGHWWHKLCQWGLWPRVGAISQLIHFFLQILLLSVSITFISFIFYMPLLYLSFSFLNVSLSAESRLPTTF